MSISSEPNTQQTISGGAGFLTAATVGLTRSSISTIATTAPASSATSTAAAASSSPESASVAAAPAAPKKRLFVESETLNQEFYEKQLKEKEKQAYDDERQAFISWLEEHESEKAKVYLQCADNMERMCQAKGERFYGKIGGKVLLPIPMLNAAIAGSKQLTDAHRELFRGAIEAYLSYRGLSLQTPPPARPKAAPAPSQPVIKTAASKITRTVRSGAVRAKAVSSSSRSSRSVTAVREEEIDPMAVSHEELVRRAGGVTDTLDYETIAPLLERINEEFPEHELIGEISIDEDEFRALKSYFSSTYKANYARHLMAERYPNSEAAEADDSFVLDRPSLVTMVAVAKRINDMLDYWDELARVVYGIDSDRFDEAWLVSAFMRSMMRYGKAMARTNKQRTLNTLAMHASC